MKIALVLFYIFAKTKNKILVFCPIDIFLNGDVLTTTKRKYLCNKVTSYLYPEFIMVLLPVRHRNIIVMAAMVPATTGAYCLEGEADKDE